jgi:hypothetical protein
MSYTNDAVLSSEDPRLERSHGTDDLTAEASTLRWAPGFRPYTIQLDGITAQLATERKSEGRIYAWVYDLGSNRKLTVYND